MSAIFVSSLSFDSTLFLRISGDVCELCKPENQRLAGVFVKVPKRRDAVFAVRWYNSAGRQEGALACQHNNASSIRYRKKGRQ
jgi:hypothetical protein